MDALQSNNLRKNPQEGLCCFNHIIGKKQILTGVLLLILPFLIFYWMVPFVSSYSIGNDYGRYWIEMQTFLQFSVNQGTFPLYAPGFNGGWTSSAMTLGQLYHPISWIAQAIPGYWEGHANKICTILRLLSLGTVHFVLFLFLLRLRLKTLASAVLSFIGVYNLRMLDMFRYAASLENYVACILLFIAIGWYYLSPPKRFGYIFISLCTWLLIVGGHPQIMYIGLINTTFIIAVTPFYIAALLPDEGSLSRERLRQYFISVSCAVVLGTLLSACYILPFYFEYVRESIRNLGDNYLWACGNQDTVLGAFRNFFDPFYSDVHGAFGGSILYLSAALLPILYFFKVKIPRSILAIWFFCFVVFILTMGSNGFLYYYFWKFFPFVQTFREPGRLGLVLPYMFMLILVWMVQLKPYEFKIGQFKFSLAHFALILIITLALFIALRLIYADGSLNRADVTPVDINLIPRVAFTIFSISAVAAAASCFLYMSRKRFKYLTGLAVCVAVLFQTGIALRYGTWVVTGTFKTLTLDQMIAGQKMRMGHHFPTGDTSRMITERHLKETFLEPHLARICPLYTIVDSIEQAYEHLTEEREIDHVYVEDYNDTLKNTPLPPSGRKHKDIVELAFNSFNRLKFHALCAKPSFFVFSYPFSKQWRCYVDGIRTHIYRCNAIEQGVLLQSGEHLVEFRYFSAPSVLGAVISYLAAIFVSCYFFRQISRPRLKWFLTAAAVCFLTFLLFVWYRSIYNGKNLGTSYVWTSEQVRPHLSSRFNLAYGKKTSMVSEGFSQTCLIHSSKGVDGSRTPAFGFVSDSSVKAWWQVDLNKPTVIDTIALFEMHTNDFSPTIPYDILVSNDENNWMKICTIDKISKDKPQIIEAKGLTARYIRIETCGPGKLSFCEVEVYSR